jgi:cystathionine beta-lyase/cystathionine gamma-synthase
MGALRARDGGRPLKPSTRTIRHGYDRAPSERSLKAPIFITSTFASEGFIAKVLNRFGVTYADFPAGATRAELDAMLAKATARASAQGGKVTIIQLESPANPTNALVDVGVHSDRVAGSIGIEHAYDLITDFAEALEHV